MAQVIDNTVTEGLSGKHRQIVFKQMYGNTYTAKTPAKRTKPFTPEEIQRHEHFRQAVQQAATELQDPVEKAKWEAQKGNYKTAFGACVAFHYKQLANPE